MNAPTPHDSRSEADNTAAKSGEGTAGSAAADILLTVDDVHKTYGPTHAVRGVSFRLARGQSLGIVGESGSGKSTTARMVVGLEEPDSGTIRVQGVDPHLPRAKRTLARARAAQMIFQDPYQSFDPRVRVGDAVAEPLRLHFGLGSAECARRVRDLLDLVGLTERQGSSLPADLSGGQRQRAAIARALGIQPGILVLDEAVAALDVSIQAQIIALLNQIRTETGVALLFVSHDLGVVRYLTDHAIVMRHGQVVESEATENLLSNPQHPYTQLLLDSVPSPDWDLDKLIANRRELASRGPL